MCLVNVSHPALFIFTQNKGKNTVPQVVGVPEQLKLVFIFSFSLICCVWPSLICSYTHLEPFGHHSSTCLTGFPRRVLHNKCTILSMHRCFQASLVFSKPSKINQTWISQIPSKFPDFEVNTKCTNLLVGSHGSTSNPYQKSGYPEQVLSGICYR